MKSCFALLCLLLCTVAADAQVPTWSWAKNLAYGTYLPGSNGRATRSETVDGQGNIYIASSFRDKVSFDSDSLMKPTASMYGIFIVKYNTAGALVWKKSGISRGSFIGTTGISVDKGGKVYVICYFVDTLQYEGTNIIEKTGDSQGSLQVLSLNTSDGSLNWATEVASNYNGTSLLGVNPLGEVVVTYVNMAASQDTFGIAKLNSSGVKMLEKKYNIGLLSYFNLKAISTTGSNIFVMGSFTNNFTLAAHQFTTATTDFIIARFDNSGNMTWNGGGKSSGSQPTTIGTITEDAAGNFYVATSFTGTLSLVGTSQTLVVTGKATGTELMYSKFNSGGVPVWLRQGQGTKSHYAYVIRLGADNSLFLMGRLGSKKLYLGGDSTDVAGINNSDPYYVAHLDTAGNTHWLKRVNSTGSIQGTTNMFVDNSSNVYFAGAYDNVSIPIDPFFLPTNYYNKVFYAKTSDVATTTGVITLPSDNMPATYSLSQNYPNPFNPSTRVQFTLPVESNVTMVVYDVLGRVVTELVKGTASAGTKSIEWDAANVPSGVYFCRLSAVGTADPTRHFSQSQKMLLVR